MILINTETLKLQYFPRSDQRYAILSHTWGSSDEEVTYQEMVASTRSEIIESKPGYQKIAKTCEIARRDFGLSWAWVDTCCIDKSSSAELSEAINSMFRWYQDSEVCFAYLRDVDNHPNAFKQSRWFTRGWTLQELIAPKALIFFDGHWTFRGTKSTLTTHIALITGIPDKILDRSVELDEIPVATRLSWAALRKTTREEDIAYCLLGLFDVNMPLLYGEGVKAFIRLQEAILSQSVDMSLFLWHSQQSDQLYSGLLAPGPECFREMRFAKAEPVFTQRGFYLTNRGIRLESWLYWDDSTDLAILPLYHSITPNEKQAGVCLRSVGQDLFVRTQPQETFEVRFEGRSSDFTVAKFLTQSQMEAISSNVLKIEKSDCPIRFFDRQPRGSWDLAHQLLYAGHTGAFLGYMILEADGFNFVLVCRFRNSRWAVRMVSENEWQKIESGFYNYYQNFPGQLFEEAGTTEIHLAYIQTPGGGAAAVRFKGRGLISEPCIKIFSVERVKGRRTWLA